MWVQGLGIPWTLLGCSCRFRGAGKIYWEYGSRGLASLSGAPAGSAEQVKYTGDTGSGAWHRLTPSWVPPSTPLDVCGVDGARDGVSNFFPEVHVGERIQEQTVAP